eukprot:g8424.t1
MDYLELVVGPGMGERTRYAALILHPLHGPAVAVEMWTLLAASTDYSVCCRERGQTTLYLAALTGRVEVDNAIIEHGADVKAGDRFGDTALHIAASIDSNGAEVLEFLVEAGASIEQEGYGGRIPLHAAARNRRPRGSTRPVEARGTTSGSCHARAGDANTTLDGEEAPWAEVDGADMAAPV